METQVSGRSVQFKAAACLEASREEVEGDVDSGDHHRKGESVDQISSSVPNRMAAQVRHSGRQSPALGASSNDLMGLIERQKFKCALSGRALTTETAALDHKLPIADGGMNDAANLQWLHDQVNKAKGRMSVDAFIRLCCEVADHARGVSG